jgi:phosphatidylglycerophosphatase A
MASWIAAGFGSGWLPKAPGTWGSLVALLPGYGLLMAFGPWPLIADSAGLLVLGCVACARVLPHLADKDPSWIVIDEWAGQWLCLGMAALSGGAPWPTLVLSFVAFRLLDILKPWPISRLERLGPPWWAIMADDIAAGAIGGGVIAVMGGWIG